MSVVRKLDKAEVGPVAREIFETYERERGAVPNMFRTLAHRPELLRTAIAHFRAAAEGGTLPPKLKELAAVKVSRLNACDY